MHDTKSMEMSSVDGTFYRKAEISDEGMDDKNGDDEKEDQNSDHQTVIKEEEADLTSEEWIGTFVEVAGSKKETSGFSQGISVKEEVVDPHEIPGTQIGYLADRIKDEEPEIEDEGAEIGASHLCAPEDGLAIFDGLSEDRIKSQKAYDGTLERKSSSTGTGIHLWDQTAGIFNQIDNLEHITADV